MNSSQIEKFVYSKVIDSTPDFTTTETTEELIKRTESKKVDLEQLGNFIKEIVKEELQKQTQVISVLKIRDCDYLDAKKEILELVNKHPKGISSLEIAESLCLDPVVVLKALAELKEEEKIGKIN
jgi:KaiC/GvpD/RAD55 family RecA-like ATPase